MIWHIIMDKTEDKNSTKMVREAGLDKFYTKINISKMCIDEVEKYVKLSNFDLIIEPSAGNGSFYSQIRHKNKIGIDISPELDVLIKKDFLLYIPPKKNNKILVIGNPPFGKVSSLAVKFFNHSSIWADTIAFIIPRTFRRISVQN